MNLAMGGYGIYVWSSFGITMGVLSINLFLSLLEQRRIKKIIRSQ